MKKIVIISAHPDDETLGAGGTLLKHRSQGDEIFWVIITGIFEEIGFSAARIKSRAQEIKQVSEEFGFSRIFQLGYPTMSLTDSTLNKLISQISDIFHTVQPEVLYVMNRSDAHSDHRVTFDAVLACTKSFRYPFIKRVLMYECISETEFAPALPEKVFIPNYYVDITEMMNRKLQIMEIFASEIGEHPFPRSFNNIKALAHFRGASVGVNYAEAFQLLKFIDK